MRPTVQMRKLRPSETKDLPRAPPLGRAEQGMKCSPVYTRGPHSEPPFPGSPVRASFPVNPDLARVPVWLLSVSDDVPTQERRSPRGDL